jgi:hypothetical protein
MSNYINRLIDDNRGREPTITKKEPVVEQTAEEAEYKTRLFLKENSHIIYRCKVHRKTNRTELIKIRDELYYSKYQVEITVEKLRPILREEITKFDVSKYEKEKGISRK